MNTVKWMVLGFGLLVLNACAATVPLSSRLSETMMSNIRPDTGKGVVYEFKSGIKDGELQAVAKDSRTPSTMGSIYVHNESVTLDKMLRDFLDLKFGGIDPSAPRQVRVTLRDFWIEQYNTESTGRQIAVGLFGGEMNIAIVAHIDIDLEYSNGDKHTTKRVRVDADSTHVQGVGTYSGTSAFHRGRDSIEFRVAEAVNGANRKAIIILNAMIESNQ